MIPTFPDAAIVCAAIVILALFVFTKSFTLPKSFYHKEETKKRLKKILEKNNAVRSENPH